MTLHSHAWPPARLGEAIEALALKSGLLAAPLEDLRGASRNPEGLPDDALDYLEKGNCSALAVNEWLNE